MITLNRITTGWNLRRFFFLAIGIVYLITCIGDRMWFGIIFSLYFIVQAVLGFGCASGRCADDSCEIK
jgi:hypothetical protein